MPKNFGEDFARLVSQELAVAPGVVGRARIAPRYDWPSGLRTGAQASCQSGSSKPYRFGSVLERRQVVVADLVAQAARAGMDQHGDLAFAQAHHLGGSLVEHAVDDLDFQKVIAGAERAALVKSAGDRPIAYPARVSAFQAAAGLGDEQVAVGTISQVDDVRCPFSHQASELGLSNLYSPL